MPGQVLAIARNTFIEAVREPVYFILIMLSGLLQVFTTWSTGFSMGYSDSAEVSGDNKLLLDIGLATIFVCGTLLAGFVSTAVISREIENRTVLTIVSKPIPRLAVVLGKYVGALAALLMAAAIMILFLLLSIRHGVMSTAADSLDGPVLVFGLGAVALSIAIGIWCNFFYGWMFTQTAVLGMFPLTLLAYGAVLAVSKKWEWQALGHDIKPQVLTACAAVLMAQGVVTALATAASARLGQVMTILVCFGVFLLGLLSNNFAGRFAFDNQHIGIVKEATPQRDSMAQLTNVGDTIDIVLHTPANVPLDRGASIYYGPNPNGYRLAVPPFPPVPTGAAFDRDKLFLPDSWPALVITDIKDAVLSVTMVGPSPLGVQRPPHVGDYVFLRPTRTNTLARVVWGLLPNLHFFWLVDPVTQNVPVPGGHLALVALYSACQIGVFLSLAAILFERRELG